MFKKLIMALAVMGMTALPFASVSAAGPIQVESQMKVANTSTNNQYQDSVSATDDQVVAIQVWYHNREEADSGLVAKNVKIAVGLPTGQGKVQTLHSTVSGDNTNTSTDTTTVNLPTDVAYLDFIPGSGIWRHNIGTNTNVNYVDTKLTSAQEQALLNGGVVIGDQNPCFNFEATITILARVRTAAVSLQKLVRVDGQNVAFTQTNSANPGDTLDYDFTVKNMGNTTLTQVQVADNLPPYMTYVAGSARLTDTLTGSGGKALSDDHITSGGITIDDMAPGSVQYVTFKVQLADSIPCGQHPLTNIGLVKANGVAGIYNQAVTNVNVTCNTPTPPPTTTPPSTTLPQTGMEGAAGMVGTGALGYAVQAWRKSKRSLADALRKIGR